LDGLTFKDLNRNGKLDPYEDWRLPAEAPTADLVQRMSLEELAGVMVHGTLPSAGPLVPLGVGKEYDPTGFVVVADPAQADLAIIRAPAPYESEHPNFFFGSRQHEGRLAFTEKDAAYAELLRVSPLVPTVFLTTLERPLILTNIRLHATALLGLITGEVSPGRHLPFELPSSVEEVRQQRSDLPHDSRSRCFPLGSGYIELSVACYFADGGGAGFWVKSKQSVMPVS
jgi:hypothetical protein